ncbi:hypothetical protein [Pseudomonas cichorii]|uniref:hypothetical protein n=1 Tax=Pseudomonas cichorii TaxID=36746 RepID=UPI0019108115|nr:hypothetical protein [Pseudomonas cichorii]
MKKRALKSSKSAQKPAHLRNFLRSSLRPLNTGLVAVFTVLGCAFFCASRRWAITLKTGVADIDNQIPLTAVYLALLADAQYPYAGAHGRASAHIKEISHTTKRMLFILFKKQLKKRWQHMTATGKNLPSAQ